MTTIKKSGRKFFPPTFLLSNLAVSHKIQADVGSKNDDDKLNNTLLLVFHPHTSQYPAIKVSSRFRTV